jgi:hypothetical protein
VARPSNLPAVLIERIEFAYPEPALFSATETDEWPPGNLERLVSLGIPRPTHRASALYCPGCDWHCHKPVVVRKTKTVPLAFVSCNEEPDHGQIPIPLQSLAQYTATLASIASFISELMALGPPRSSGGGGLLLLGTIKERHGPRDVSLGLHEGRLVLRVGRQRENAIRILHWIDNRAFLDVAHIRRLARRKDGGQASGAHYLPDRSRQRARTRQTQARNKAIFREAKKRRATTSESWTAIATALAATDLARAGDRRAVSADRLRRIITEMLRRERENSRSKHKPLS